MSAAIKGHLVNPAARQRLVGVVLSKRKYPVQHALLFDEEKASFVGGARFAYWIEDAYTQADGRKAQPLVDHLFRECDRMVLLPDGWTIASTIGQDGRGIHVRWKKESRSKNAWRPRYGADGLNLTTNMPDRWPVWGRKATWGHQEVGSVPDGQSTLFLADGWTLHGHTEVHLHGRDVLVGSEKVGKTYRNKDDSIRLPSGFLFNGEGRLGVILKPPEDP